MVESAFPHFAPPPKPTSSPATTGANMRLDFHISYTTPRYGSQLYANTKKIAKWAMFKLKYNDRTTLFQTIATTLRQYEYHLR